MDEAEALAGHKSNEGSGRSNREAVQRFPQVAVLVTDVDGAVGKGPRMGNQEQLGYGVDGNQRTGILSDVGQGYLEAGVGGQVVELGGIVGVGRGAGKAGGGIHGQSVDEAVAKAGELGDVASGEIDQCDLRNGVWSTLGLR